MSSIQLNEMRTMIIIVSVCGWVTASQTNTGEEQPYNDAEKF